MKRILILADMEGCCGIHDLSDEEFCVSCMIAEVDYIIHELQTLLPCEITILDCHNDGLSLKQHCESCHIPFVNHLWSLDHTDYDMAFLVGFHGMRGQEGILSHTMRNDIVSLKIGEQIVGEVGLLMDWLASYGIPAVYISGDQSIKAELCDYAGVFVPVKGREIGVPSLNELKDSIHTAIKRAIVNVQMPVCRKESVQIELIGETYVKHIPMECFEVKGCEIIFQSSRQLVQIMPLLCEFLNIADWFQQTRFAQLKRRLSKADKALINRDARANEILSHKEWRSLTNEDFLYLSMLAKQMEDNNFQKNSYSGGIGGS